MSFFDPKTQVYVDNALNTLQIWFGTGGSGTGSGTSMPPTGTGGTGTGGTGTGGIKPPPRNTPTGDDSGKKTLKYVGIGAGVIVVGLVTFVLIKRAKNK